MVFQVCSNFHPGVELFRPDISNLAVHIKWGGSQWDNDRSSRPSQGRDEMRNNYLTEVINSQRSTQHVDWTYLIH